MRGRGELSILANERDSTHVGRLPVFVRFFSMADIYLFLDLKPLPEPTPNVRKGAPSATLYLTLRISPLPVPASPFSTSNTKYTFHSTLSFLVIATFRPIYLHVSWRRYLSLAYLVTSTLSRGASLHHGHLRQELSALRPEASDEISVRWRRCLYSSSILPLEPLLRGDRRV